MRKEDPKLHVEESKNSVEELSKYPVYTFLNEDIREQKLPYCPEAVNEEYIILPNPDDCESFFVCREGYPILQKCLQGEYFDKNKLKCVRDESVCIITTTTELITTETVTPTTESTTTTAESITTSTEPSTTTTESITTSTEPSITTSESITTTTESTTTTAESITTSTEPSTTTTESIITSTEPSTTTTESITTSTEPSTTTTESIITSTEPSTTTTESITTSTEPSITTTESITTTTESITTTTESSTPFVCPSERNNRSTALYPHPTDCTKFYDCTNGNPELEQFPLEQYFDKELTTCIRLIKDCCDPKTNRIRRKKTFYSISTSVTCPSESSEDPSLIADPQDCRKFYDCSFGSPINESCPPSKYFHSEKQICLPILKCGCANKKTEISFF